MGFFSSPSESARAAARERDTGTKALSGGGTVSGHTAKKVTKRDRAAEGKVLKGKGRGKK